MDIEYLTIRITEDEYECVYQAAKDAHMGTEDYARLMVLCAAGMGGVLEHLQRASDASVAAELAAGTIVEVTP